jgi:transcription elongation factor Elf1
VDNAPTLPSPERGGENAATGPQAGEGKNQETRPCPFCGATDTDVISLFGSQVMTMQCKCRACGSFYEASKY